MQLCTQAAAESRACLANPPEPSRLDELNDWYDTYSAAITSTAT